MFEDTGDSFDYTNRVMNELLFVAASLEQVNPDPVEVALQSLLEHLQVKMAAGQDLLHHHCVRSFHLNTRKYDIYKGMTTKTKLVGTY